MYIHSVTVFKYSAHNPKSRVESSSKDCSYPVLIACFYISQYFVFKLFLISPIHGTFLQAIEVSSNEYEPSEKDVIFAEGVTQGNGLAFIEFTLDDRSPMSEPYIDNQEAHSQPLTKYNLLASSTPCASKSCTLMSCDKLILCMFCSSDTS